MLRTRAFNAVRIFFRSEPSEVCIMSESARWYKRLFPMRVVSGSLMHAAHWLRALTEESLRAFMIPLCNVPDVIESPRIENITLPSGKKICVIRMNSHIKIWGEISILRLEKNCINREIIRIAIRIWIEFIKKTAPAQKSRISAPVKTTRRVLGCNPRRGGSERPPAGWSEGETSPT